MLRRENRIVTALGRKGSGKSYTLATQYIVHEPRVLTIDWTGESHEMYPHAIEAVGYRGTIETLREVVAVHLSDGTAARWHVIAVVSPEDAGRLFAVLAPHYSGKNGPLPFTRKIGGLAVECGEIDRLAPSTGPQEEFANLVHRGRHTLTSLYLATRRPADCSRLITSQADEVISFAMHEPRDLKFLRETSAQLAQVVPTLKPHWYAQFRAIDASVHVFNPDGVEVKQKAVSNKSGKRVAETL